MKTMLLALSLLVPVCVTAASVVGSKHDLSVAGGGSVKAAAETDVCIFCHTPHNGSTEAPLWNRYSSGAFYTPYNSTTMKAAVGQPTGASKLCLSCHDGTVALGMVRSRTKPIAMAGGTLKMPKGRSNLGTDLSDDHPVSFTYDPALLSKDKELRNPGSLSGAVQLDHSGQLQCTSCHDSHNNQFGKFLVVNNEQSALCVACHNKTDWASSDHRTSSRKWNGQGQDPWPHTEGTTVAANGCENCHTPHVAGSPTRLMNFAEEEQNCYPCHNGNAASKNIQAEFVKYSRHDVAATTGVHDPTENIASPPRHVECVDCHNPHAARSGDSAGMAGGLIGVPGVSAAGSSVQMASHEYEICFRCHESSSAGDATDVQRQSSEPNLRLQFAPANGSYHPVVAAGKNPNVPSLVSPYTASSLIACTDCHNNDQGPVSGGKGPNGPHGSSYAPLLAQKLVMTDYGAESQASYALCYRCHSRKSILSNESFPAHSLHVVDQKTACTTCHDSHGVTSASRLINFNVQYVSAGSSGTVSYQSTGKSQGSCTLTCHGTVHDNTTYAPAGPGTVTPAKTSSSKR